MKRKLTTFITALLVVSFSITSHSQKNASLVTQPQINDLANALLAYASVALACSDQRSYDQLRIRLVKLLELAKEKNSLTRDGKRTYNNTSSYLESGAEFYKEQPYITCGEAKGYTSDLITSADSILEANG